MVINNHNLNEWMDSNEFFCSKCGFKNDKKLGERLGKCPKCGNKVWRRGK